MSKSDPLSLTQILLLSSTPGYLMSKMRAHPAVMKISKALDISELMHVYQALAIDARLAKSSVGQVAALGYATLIAVTLKEDINEVRKVFEQLRSYDLEWTPHIIQKFMEEKFSTQVPA